METDGSDAEFESLEVLRSNLTKRKRAPPSTDRSLKCKTCGKKFSDHNDRKKHELIHLPGFPYACDICKYRGKTKHYLARHKKKVHAERNIKCDHCPAVFIYQCKKDEHMRVHTGEKPYKCDHCPKTFRVPYSLKCHMLIHTDEKPYQCSFCDYACRDNSTLRKHQNKHMGLVKLFHCTICKNKKSFKHKWMLKCHISEEHLKMDLKKHKCGECGKLFRSKTHVAVHVKQVHDRVYATRCPVCNVFVSSRYNLRLHLTSHVDYRPYVCIHSGCNKAFKDRSTLKKHTMIHKPELHYPCKQCDMKFSRKHRLVKHLTTHEDRKRDVVCDYCRDIFYSKNYLIQHIKQKHTEQQTYICDECGMRTTNKPGMILHLKYGHNNHDNDRKCKICHIKFKRHEYLKQHYYRTHNVRYKMVKPYGKRQPKQVTDMKAEVKVKMEPVDEDFDQIDLLNVDKAEIQEDCLEYSQCVLNEDIQACVLGSKRNNDEVVFDQFLVTHMFRKTKDEEVQIPEDVNQIELQKSNSTIDELLKLCEERRLKRDRVRRVRYTEQKKKEVEEKKRRDEIYLARREKEEINEFEKLILKYNERMKNISINKFKKKENTKIKHFKPKTNQNTNEKVDLSDDEDESISFAIKPNQNSEKCNEIIKTNDKNNDSDDKNEDNDELVEKNDKTNEINDQLVTENSDIGENSKKYQVYNDEAELNEINDEEKREISEQNENTSEKNEQNTRSDSKMKDNNELTNKKSNNKINSNKNDLNEENGDENDKNDESLEINDKIDENNDVRRSNRKRKPNKIYEKEVNETKHKKMNFKTHQCYVCFKLYPTKEELIQHCQEHFDICNLKTLTKCPICEFVTPKSLSAHLLKKHEINLKIPFNHIKQRKDNDGSKYCYDAKGTIIEVIPSIKILNQKAYIEIDKKNRENKAKSLTKTKLIRKGKEWIVEKEHLDVKFDLLPQFNEKDYKKLKISDNYIDRMKQIYKLAKKRNLKMAFPCFDCDKICLNLSALKLHNRKHQNNPKPFRPRGEVKKEKEENKCKKVVPNFKNRNAKPKPIKNKHKCDDELKKFYETNIRGGDIEFWQFLKIFNKMDRENITEFDELEERKDFGIHIHSKNVQSTTPVAIKSAKIEQTATKNSKNTKNKTPNPETSLKTAKIDTTTTKNITKPAQIGLTATKSTAVSTKNSKNVNITTKPTYKRVVMISKDEYKKRIEAKNRLREKNLSQNA